MGNIRRQGINKGNSAIFENVTPAAILADSSNLVLVRQELVYYLSIRTTMHILRMLISLAATPTHKTNSTLKKAADDLVQDGLSALSLHVHTVGKTRMFRLEEGFARSGLLYLAEYLAKRQPAVAKL
jgi:hypothetical protein